MSQLSSVKRPFPSGHSVWPAKAQVLTYLSLSLQVGLGGRVGGKMRQEVSSPESCILALNGALFNWNYLETV